MKYCEDLHRVAARIREASENNGTVGDGRDLYKLWDKKVRAVAAIGANGREELAAKRWALVACMDIEEWYGHGTQELGLSFLDDYDRLVKEALLAAE